VEAAGVEPCMGVDKRQLTHSTICTMSKRCICGESVAQN
jgi:hypothetical protein